MDTAYHPDFGVKVAYQIDRMPNDPEAQVRQSMAKAICLIREDAQRDWFEQITPDGQKNQIRNTIKDDAARAAQGGDPISGVWAMVKPHIKFRQDAAIARDLDIDDSERRKWNVGDDTVEVFIRPVDQSLLIGLRQMGVEDCDGFTMYGACLLTALGIPCSLVTVAADKSRPREFSHVYVAAYFDGKRIPLDFSHGSHPGWECPHHRIREWPVWVTTTEKVTNALTPIALVGALYLGLRWINKRKAA